MVSKTLTLASLMLLFTGCSITGLSHNGIPFDSERRSGEVQVTQYAEGLPGSKVGWGRFTVFYIPVVPIYIAGDESQQLVNNIAQALATAGYTTVTASGSDTQGAVLTAEVSRIRFNNYTWFAPIVPTWGRINVTLSLIDQNQSVLWTRDFEGRGSTFNFFDGYTIASRRAMSRMLGDMAAAFARDDFFDAINSLGEAGVAGT